MAYNKTNWENSPSTNTPINASNLNKIEEGIYSNSLKTDQIGSLSNLKTTAKSTLVDAINELKDAEVYSTNEVKTNKIWNDKLVYRQVVNVNSMFPNGITANSTNTMSYPIPNFETLTKAKLLRIGSNPLEIMGLCYIQYITSQEQIQIKVGDCTLSIGTGQNLQLVLEYTKTTD